MSVIHFYLITGAIIAVITLFLMAAGYFIYRKILKGEKKLSLAEAFLIFVFLCYIFAVIKAVFIGRPVRERVIVPYLFDSYKEAWNDGLAIQWLYLILNIMMFVPLGFLLPLLTKKLRKLWKVALIALSATLVCEIVQYITGVGIFEMDDIFNNFLGSVIGCGFAMACLNVFDRERRRFSTILVYLIPFLFTVAAFITIGIVYQVKI